MTLAYAMIFTLPGIPSIYYGDEIGMQGYKDPFNRAFFDWESRETRIRPVLQNLAALRKSCPAFADGTLAVTQAQGGVLCYERRAECFEYLLAHGILTSSEEVSDWAVPSLVFCHYAPYDFQMRSPDAPRHGIPVPLYNLVYHDCVIQPWMMDRVAGGDDYMLYALLNGGAPYLIRDAAYAGMDGDMNAALRARTENDIERCAVVAGLHRRVGMQELVRHDLVGGDPLVQRSVFADGTAVTCDFHAQTYEVAANGSH